jgi:hypothetical protein
VRITAQGVDAHVHAATNEPVCDDTLLPVVPPSVLPNQVRSTEKLHGVSEMQTTTLGVLTALGSISIFILSALVAIGEKF